MEPMEAVNEWEGGLLIGHSLEQTIADSMIYFLFHIHICRELKYQYNFVAIYGCYSHLFINKISEHDNVCCLLTLNLAFTEIGYLYTIYLALWMTEKSDKQHTKFKLSASSSASNDRAVKPRQEGKTVHRGVYRN